MCLIRKDESPVVFRRGFGVSTPWVDKYTVLEQKEDKEGSWFLTVQFDLMTSTGPAGSYVYQRISLYTAIKHQRRSCLSYRHQGNEHRLNLCRHVQVK